MKFLKNLDIIFVMEIRNMEIKNKNDEWVSIDKGDMISDGFEEGICVSVLKDGGDIEFGVWDGKEGWSVNLREVKKVNGEDVNLIG